MLLAQLEIDPSERVRVFDLIEDYGIWLTFEPLDRLFGWYHRVQDAAGVVINSSHPVPLQRFTAAHELGHHVLGHSYSLDDERTIIEGGQGTDPNEVAAHTFAANLLMPLAAVEFHLARLGLDRAHPVMAPVDAYRLSVELGVSYSAAVVQLASLNKIAWSTVPDLQRARPLELKQLVGRVPDYARAAVWSLNLTDDGRHLLVDTGDELIVRLEEIRSSGYRWTPAPVTFDGFTVISDSLLPLDATEPRRYGAPQVRLLIFKATNSGSHSIVIDLHQTWDHETEPTRRFGVAVDIEAPRISAVGRGVSVNQQLQLVVA